MRRNHKPPKPGRVVIAGLLLVPYLLLVLLPSPSAHAASAGVAAAGGSGSVTPPVTAFPGTHAWSALPVNGLWHGVLAGDAGTAFPFSCSLMWNTAVSGTENLAIGVGVGTLSCSSPPHGWISDITVARVGTLLVVGFTPSGPTSLVGTAVCVLLPSPVTNGPPLSTFTLICGAAGVSRFP